MARRKTEDYSCGNACGEGWCCSRHTSVYDIPLDRGSDGELNDIVQLSLLRELDVAVDVERRALVVVLKSPCSKLTEAGACWIHHSKPEACRNFPLFSDQEYLPSSCSFSGQPHVVRFDKLPRVTGLSAFAKLRDKARRGDVPALLREARRMEAAKHKQSTRKDGRKDGKRVVGGAGKGAGRGPRPVRGLDV